MNVEQRELTSDERKALYTGIEIVNESTDQMISVIFEATGMPEGTIAMMMAVHALKYIKEVDSTLALAKKVNEKYRMAVSEYHQEMIERIEKGEG